MLYLSPPLEHARAAWIHQFHAYLHTVAGLPRLRSKSFAVLGGGEGSTDYQRVVKALPREILKKAYEEIESRLAEVCSCLQWVPYFKSKPESALSYGMLLSVVGNTYTLCRRDMTI